jgi:hypothetical protein
MVPSQYPPNFLAITGPRHTEVKLQSYRKRIRGAMLERKMSARFGPERIALLGTVILRRSN